MWTSTSAVGCVCRERQRVESAPCGAHASVSEEAKAVCAVCECVVAVWCLCARGAGIAPPARPEVPARPGGCRKRSSGRAHGRRGQGSRSRTQKERREKRETRSWKRTPVDTTIADKTQNEYRTHIISCKMRERTLQPPRMGDDGGRGGRDEPSGRRTGLCASLRCGDEPPLERTCALASGPLRTDRSDDTRREEGLSASATGKRARKFHQQLHFAHSAGGHPQTTKRVPPYGPEQTSRMYRLKCVSTHRARSNTQGRGHGLTASPSV